MTTPADTTDTGFPIDLPEWARQQYLGDVASAQEVALRHRLVLQEIADRARRRSNEERMLRRAAVQMACGTQSIHH